MTRAIGKSEAITQRRPGRLPVPVPARPSENSASTGDFDTESGNALRFTGRPVALLRPQTAFLAQLSLQYDDAPSGRRARLERTAMAARAYRERLAATMAQPARGQIRDIVS